MSQIKPPPPPSWASIPHKGQLAIICSVRTADFFQQAAIQAYMFYQLRSFSPTATDSDISFQTGVLQGVFTAAQIFTGIMWGRMMDFPSFGRKKVLLIGLTGQGISCIGVAFSKSFETAVVWRCLGGAVNGTVGGARTSLAECTEKKYHSRTFLLLPLAWNIANIFGPIFAGLLSDPVLHYPSLFGDDTLFGGATGAEWLKEYPYAPPNILCACVMFADALLVWLGLRETLISIKIDRDRGLELGDTIRFHVNRIMFERFGYTRVGTNGLEGSDREETPGNTPLTPIPARGYDPETQQKPHLLSAQPISAPPFYRAFTSNVLLVLATVALLDFQMGGFTSLWTVFLSSSPRTKMEDEAMQLPFVFTGGLGFSPSTIGLAMSILGFVGIFLQLSLYPRVNARFGLLKSTQWCLFVFPIAYALAPYLSLVKPTPFLLWCGIIVVLALQVGPRTFAVPGVVLLTNNASPSPALLGTIHGMGAATSSAFRTIGPIVAGRWYSEGLKRGSIGEAWWLLAFMSLLGVIPSFWARDGR